MSKRRETPPDIETVFDKPGRIWTEGEIVRVLEWLHELDQLRFLLQFITYHLRPTMRRPENVEDVWQDYCHTLIKKYIKRYDPELGLRFWEFLLKWLSFFCKDQCKEIDKRYNREPQMPVAEADDGSFIEVEALMTDNDEIETRFYYDELRAILERVLVKCSTIDIQVLELYLQEFRHKEIAAQLGISEENARVKLHRIFKILRERLKWMNAR